MSTDRLRTVRLPYRLIRGTDSTPISTADTGLTATTKNWSTFKTVYHPKSGSSGIAVELTENENRVIICFDFKNADDDTAAFQLWGYREGFPGEFVCSSTEVLAGSQESDGMSDHLGIAATTRYFGDTIATLTQRYYGGSSAVEIIDCTTGNNGIGRIKFDTQGLKYLLLLFTSISTSDNVRAWMSGV